MCIELLMAQICVGTNGGLVLAREGKRTVLVGLGISIGCSDRVIYALSFISARLAALVKFLDKVLGIVRTTAPRVLPKNKTTRGRLRATTKRSIG